MRNVSITFSITIFCLLFFLHARLTCTQYTHRLHYAREHNKAVESKQNTRRMLDASDHMLLKTLPVYNSTAYCLINTREGYKRPKKKEKKQESATKNHNIIKAQHGEQQVALLHSHDFKLETFCSCTKS